MQHDIAPMEYMTDEITPGEVLIFRWSGGTRIEIGRPEGEEYVWDQCIGVYDHATGEKTIPATYEAFRAKVDEWIADNR
ncbi:hypothetical protein [Streptomyces sp. URMC 129]|uniref:hypothetical protein n=1 Tax=Streptomyces sp. URMC 129 TaxID=3423407 RepID=UPI003F1CEC15